MNRLGADALSPVLLAQITADVASLLTDAQVATTSISIATPTAGSIDAASGIASLTLTTDSISGTLEPLTLLEVAESSGAYQIGDQRLRVAAADLTVAPNVDTTFTIGSAVYVVVQAVRDPLDLHWIIVGRLRP